MEYVGLALMLCEGCWSLVWGALSQEVCPTETEWAGAAGKESGLEKDFGWGWG